jgi:amidase
MKQKAYSRSKNIQPPSISEVVLMDAVTLSEAIRTRQVSCKEVMSDFLDHMETFNPRVNAVISILDREDLLKQALVRDAQLAKGQYLGWMHGFPHAVKDLARTRGIRTTMGSPIFKDFVPEVDEIFVERIKNAGAIIIGKTNVSEFGLGSQTYNPVFGATANAYDPTRTAGGSSGGAGSALALRMLPVADGSDMMGSLRNPGAFNNVFGFRPSFGRVPCGNLPEIFLKQLSSEGPMGRSVADVAMLLSVQSGHDPRSPLSIRENPKCFTETLKRDVNGVRIAWLGDLGGYLAMEKGIIPLCQKALSVFEEIGCVVEEALPDFSWERLWDIWVTLRQWLIGGSLELLFKDPAKRELMKPELQWEIEGSQHISGSDVYQASAGRTAWYDVLRKMFETYDYLLLPTAQVFPFDITTHWPKEIEGKEMTTYHKWMEVVVPGSLSGCPVMNVPVGFNAAGLPMGMQIIGRNHDDFGVLQIAHAYEQATGWVSGHLPPLLKEFAGNPGRGNR